MPEDWTVRTIVGNDGSFSRWRWTNQDPQGNTPIENIASSSAGGGWLIFDSDAGCNDPNGQDAWLISPAILRQGRENLTLEFQTFYRSFYDRAQVRVGAELANMDN